MWSHVGPSGRSFSSRMGNGSRIDLSIQQMSRIYLSSPHMGEKEFAYVQEAFATNWIAPVGPHLTAFEKEFCEEVGSPHAAAVSSGTAALHLALRLTGVQRGDEVVCSTLTFIASVNPIVQLGATPLFVDSELRSWNMDPELLRELLSRKAAEGKRPKAVVVVHLYGQSADLDAILAVCEEFEVPLIEDAAEALGAVYYTRRHVVACNGKADGVRQHVDGAAEGRAPERSEGATKAGALRATEEQTLKADTLTDGVPEGARAVTPGTLGVIGIYSFNGNKIITTSGGGMLVTARTDLVERARFLATQARDPAPHYEHSVDGYNYRMSNVLAGIGRGQLAVLAERVNARRAVFQFYTDRLGDLPGLEFMPEAEFGRSTRWLSCLTIDPAISGGVTREMVRLALEKEDVEARPVWKPMHQQPLFANCEITGGAVADRLFELGLCLPSGSNLTQSELEKVVTLVRRVWNLEGIG